MEDRVTALYNALPQEAKDFLGSNEFRGVIAGVYAKHGGPLSRDKVAAIREAFTTHALGSAPEDVRSKLILTQEQKDGIWNALSGGADTIELPVFVKMVTGIVVNALSQGIELSKIQAAVAGFA